MELRIYIYGYQDIEKMALIQSEIQKRFTNSRRPGERRTAASGLVVGRNPPGRGNFGQ